MWDESDRKRPVNLKDVFPKESIVDAGDGYMLVYAHTYQGNVRVSASLNDTIPIPILAKKDVTLKEVENTIGLKFIGNLPIYGDNSTRPVFLCLPDT